MEKFEIRGIPSLVEIDSNGDAIERNPQVDFRSLIDAHGSDAFPLTEERLAELKKKDEKLKSQKLRELYSGKIPFIPGNNSNEDIEDDIRILHDQTTMWHREDAICSPDMTKAKVISHLFMIIIN